jgi:hypothetical protein
MSPILMFPAASIGITYSHDGLSAGRELFGKLSYRRAHRQAL